MLRGPLADAVEGLARDEQVPGEQEQYRGIGDAPATVLTREPVAQRLADAEPAEKSVEDRQGADPARVEGLSIGLSDFPGGGLGKRTRDAVLLGALHGNDSGRWRGDGENPTWPPVAA